MVCTTRVGCPGKGHKHGVEDQKDSHGWWGTQDNHILKSILNSVFPKNMIEEFHGEVLSLSLTNTAEFF